MEKCLFYLVIFLLNLVGILQGWSIISGEWPYVHGSHMSFNCKFFGCSRLFFGQILDSICLSWPFKGVLSTCSTRELLPAERYKSIPYSFRVPGKVFKRSLFYFIFKKSCNIDIILHCRDNLKHFNSSIKLLNFLPCYFLIKLMYQKLSHVFLWFCSLLTPPLPTSRVQGPLLQGKRFTRSSSLWPVHLMSSG